MGGGGINEFVEFQEIIIDNTLLDFFKSKDCEFITCLGDSMEEVIKEGVLFPLISKTCSS